MFFMKDITDLIAIHDMVASRRVRERSKNTPGEISKSGRNLDVLRRAGIILLITAWETFVEDLLRAMFLERLESANNPSDLQRTFNTIACVWLEERKRNNQSINPPELLLWAGEGWKKMILDNFKNELAALNTPNSENVKKLFSRYLGEKDITQYWQSSKTPGIPASARLDDLIKRRGALVHRGEALMTPNVTITKQELDDAKSLVGDLVEQTAKAMGISTLRSQLD
jgi:hypothetical protein